MTTEWDSYLARGVKVPPQTMRMSRVGSQGLVASQQGFGCMGMTAFYGDFSRTAQEEDNLATIATAVKLGITLFDTAWIYQSFGRKSN